MTTYAVFGLGMMGQAIMYDLLQYDGDSIVIGFESQQATRERIAEKFSTYKNRIEIQPLILGMDTDLTKELEGVDIAFGAIDYKYNEILTSNCIKYGTHFLDLGGNPTVVKKQFSMHNQAQEKDIVIIPDCGLAPGMVNVIAAGLMNKFEELDECHIRVGGLPQNPEGILKYQQVFSIRGLTNEYLEDAIVIRNGKITTVPSLTEIEELNFPPPFNNLEAFQTAGGTAALPRLFEHKINQLTYKTIRYKNHLQYFQFLQQYGLLEENTIEGTTYSPREIVEKQLVKHLPRNKPDVVLIRISISGKKDGNNIVEEWNCIDKFDENTGYSSMARTTSFPISIIGQLIASGKITERGVVEGERVVVLSDFISELEKRDIKFKQNVIIAD